MVCFWQVWIHRQKLPYWKRERSCTPETCDSHLDIKRPCERSWYSDTPIIVVGKVCGLTEFLHGKKDAIERQTNSLTKPRQNISKLAELSGQRSTCH